MDLSNDIALFEAAWGNIHGHDASVALAQFDARRGSLTPQEVARLDPAFRTRTRYTRGLYPVPVPQRRWPWQRGDREQAPDPDQIFAADPALALLALHCANGLLREKAITLAPMSDTAARAALLLRCNDWAAPVREAAFTRLDALLPTLDTPALEPLCLFALDRVAHWQRGGAAALDRLAAHPDWPRALTRTFLHHVNGPLSRTLRGLLRTPAYDSALEDFALKAKSPFVRFVATQTILTGTARWKEGYDWVWHDKVFHLRSRVPRWGKRKVDVSPDLCARVMQGACHDKSAKIRCLVLDRLILSGPSGAETDALLRVLTQDSAVSVRERMDFYTRKWGDATAP